MPEEHTPHQPPALTDTAKGVPPQDTRLEFGKRGSHEFQLEAQYIFGKKIYVIIDPEGSSAYFSHDKESNQLQIVLGMKMIEMLNLESGGQLFVGYHELGHLKQFLQEHEAFEGFHKMVESAGKLFPGIQAQLIHFIYNAILDIPTDAYARSCTSFRQGEAYVNSPRRARLNSLDLADIAKCNSRAIQFAGYLLRAMYSDYDDDMALLDASPQDGQSQMTFFPEVREVLAKPPEKYYGDEYPNIISLVRAICFRPDVKLGDVLRFTEHVLNPIIYKLLRIDQGDDQSKVKQMATSGSDVFDEKMQKVLESVRQEDAKTPKDLERDARTKKTQDKLVEAGLKKEEAVAAGERDQRCYAIARALMDVYNSLYRDEIRTTQSIETVSGFRSGRLNVQSLIAGIPAYERGDMSAVRPFERTLSIEKEDRIPVLNLHITLACDVSGSMLSGDPPRINSVRDMAYSIALSQLLHAQYMRHEYDTYPSKLGSTLVDFGDNATVVGTTEVTQSTKIADAITALQIYVNKEIEGKGGNSGDDQAIDETLKGVDERATDSVRTKQTKPTELMIYITDGGTGVDHNVFREKIRLAKSKGVQLLAIQIDQHLSEGERNSFQDVFGENGRKIQDLASLPSVIQTFIEGFVDKLKKGGSTMH